MTCTIEPNKLAGFIGTNGYHKHWATSFRLTDGVSYLVENGVSWLVDHILLWGQEQALCKKDRTHMQVWTLRKTTGNKARLFCTDGNYVPLCEREIDFTDFTLSEVKLMLIDGILLLASEY